MAGRKAHKPTPETLAQVEALAGYGIQQAEIAAYIGIDAKTLRKHYELQLGAGATKATVAVARALHKNAIDGNNVTAQIFWMKTRGGWHETQNHRHAGANGGPIQTVNLTNASDADLDRLEQILSRCSVAGGSSGGEETQGG